MNAFIITLASASLFMGGMLILTKAVDLQWRAPRDRELRAAALGLRVVAATVLALAIGAALIILFRFTALGREILAAGANARAAELSGVPVGRITIFVHTLSGLLRGLRRA